MSASDKLEKYYSLLGVRTGAGMKEVREAYHSKAARLHPDRCQGDPLAAEAFKKVNIAYRHIKKHLRSVDGPKNKNEIKLPFSPTKTPGGIPGWTPAPPPPPAAPPPEPEMTLDELVLRLRHSQNSYVRVHAVHAIAAKKEKEAVWALLPALNDPAPGVAAAAIAALGALRAGIATVPLIHLHKKSGKFFTEKIEKALEQIDSPLSKRYLKSLHPEQQQPTPATNQNSNIA